MDFGGELVQKVVVVGGSAVEANEVGLSNLRRQLAGVLGNLEEVAQFLVLLLLSVVVVVVALFEVVELVHHLIFLELLVNLVLNFLLLALTILGAVGVGFGVLGLLVLLNAALHVSLELVAELG